MHNSKSVETPLLTIAWFPRQIGSQIDRNKWWYATKLVVCKLIDDNINMGDHGACLAIMVGIVP
jgi:hypothetical protein